MNWHAAPVAILVGVTGYAAVLFMGLYFALADVAEERTRREYLTFALTCAAVVAYDVTCIGLYNSHSIEQGFFWNRGQWLTGGWLAVSYQAFVWDFLKRRTPRVLRYGAVLMALLGIVTALWESEYTATIARPTIKHVFILGSDIVYYEVEPGIITQVLLLLSLVLYVVNVFNLFRYFRSQDGRQQRGHLGFVVATIVAGLCVTSDILVTVGVYTSLYAYEYGITAILIAIGYVLLMRFGELHKSVNTLNRNLSRTNANLVIALEQAQESSRTKTEFLASISHELRTPLNAIINLPEGLMEEFEPFRCAQCEACGAKYELELDEQVSPGLKCDACSATALKEHTALAFVGDAENAHACLRTVDEASRHLLGLVNDILDASKLELGRTEVVPSSFDPRDLVREVVDSARALASKSQCSLHFMEPANDVWSGPVMADRVRIAQVLYNLLTNAIKFSPARSVVQVSLSTRPDQEWEFCVRDQGIGIDPAHHALIFERFRQVDGGATRAYGGTGLGLAISKGLVEMHGGRIWVESVKGHGAAFFVRLPARIVRRPSDLTEPRLEAGGQ